MKEFEKWYNELPMREDAIDFTIPTYEDYKKGWRAALECLQSRIKFGVTVAYSDADVLMIIRKFIKKELES